MRLVADSHRGRPAQIECRHEENARTATERNRFTATRAAFREERRIDRRAPSVRLGHGDERRSVRPAPDIIRPE